MYMGIGENNITQKRNKYWLISSNKELLHCKISKDSSTCS